MWNLESSTWDPEYTSWNPEFQTVTDYLTCDEVLIRPFQTVTLKKEDISFNRKTSFHRKMMFLIELENLKAEDSIFKKLRYV